MYELIAKVEYKWGIRYWCFYEGLVADVYDEVDDVVTRNKEKAWIFDDMSFGELKCACKNQYTITAYKGDKLDELLHDIMARIPWKPLT